MGQPKKSSIFSGKKVLLMAAAVVAVAASGWWLRADEEPAEDAKAAKVYTAEEIAAAKKHADFAKLAGAKTVVVGKVTGRVEAVAESFPPIYQLRMSVKPTEVIAGEARVGKWFTFNYSISQVKEPTFDDSAYIVAIGTADDPDRVLILRPADDATVAAARVATSQGQLEQAKNEKLARDNPEMHPLFEKLQKVDNIVLLKMSSDPDGVVSFDVRSRLETHGPVTVVKSLKGEIEPGVLKALSFTEAAAGRTGQGVLLAVIQMRDKRPVVTETFRASEEFLRVAAAASEADIAEVINAADKARIEYNGQRPTGQIGEIIGGFLDGISGGDSGQSEPGFAPEDIREEEFEQGFEE